MELAVFELYNITNTPEWERISADSDSGKITRDEFIQAIMRSEFNTAQRTRAFYLNFFLPWLRAKHLEPTCPDQWHCEDFRNPETLRWKQAVGRRQHLSLILRKHL